MEQQMEEQEAYKILQAAWVKLHDLRVGDKVKVVSKFQCQELGFAGDEWNSCGTKEESQGRIVRVYKIAGRDIKLHTTDGREGNDFPFFALDIVNQPRNKEKMIEINGKSWSEVTIAEALRKHAE